MGMNKRKHSTEREVKCVIVGDGGVGKTSLLMSFTTGGIMMDYIPTCFDCYTVDIKMKERSYAMTLIDTAGQETYDRLRTLSYYSTDVFIVCFSVADQDSFENVKSKWIPEIKQYRPNTPYIVVGTQTDLRQSKADSTEFKVPVFTDLLAPDELKCEYLMSHEAESAFQPHSEGTKMASNKSATDFKGLQCFCSKNRHTVTTKCISPGKGKSAAKKFGAEHYLECSALGGQGVPDVFMAALRTAVKPRRTKNSILKSLVSVFRTKKATEVDRL